MIESSRSKALREIFREEALAHKNRSGTGLGDPLRLSAARLQFALWALVGLLALGLAAASRLDFVSSLVHGSSPPSESSR